MDKLVIVNGNIKENIEKIHEYKDIFEEYLEIYLKNGKRKY